MRSKHTTFPVFRSGLGYGARHTFSGSGGGFFSKGLLRFLMDQEVQRRSIQILPAASGAFRPPKTLPLAIVDGYGATWTAESLARQLLNRLGRPGQPFVRRRKPRPAKHAVRRVAIDLAAAA